MLPRLQAQERLQSIIDVACGTGHLTETAAAGHRAALDRAWHGIVEQPAQAPGREKLATSGIGLRIVSAPYQEALSGSSETENGDG